MDNLQKYLDTAASTALAAWFLFLGLVAFLTAILAMTAAEIWRNYAWFVVFMAGVLLGWLV